ncbi:hypothetical protein QTH90_04805 [Variovorax sp. J2P1-59]|uniref:hypothetical protein n=1 Tax=Variovorax flavidus TaxID=3053501 RepID=UPI002575E7E4|nr:hypothetical protein [Variovorax sp. J2P1-59]MDM0073686.1 hypothetical protein [Variovorax sp. J2P1-59]
MALELPSPEPTHEHRRVELGSIDILPHGEGFVLGLVDASKKVHRMSFPSWTLHQLMRLLPRLDAALAEARKELSTSLIAYPIVRWDLERVGSDHAVALSVETDRGVESAFLLSPEDASALRARLGEALGDLQLPDHAELPPRPSRSS